MDSQFFKPPPIGTMMPHSRSPPNYTPHPHPPPPTPDGMPFADALFFDPIFRPPPPPIPSTKPTKFSRGPPMNHLPLFIGGVQSAPKGATPPPTGGILDKLSSSMDGMMIPLLIGGGVLLIILIR